MGAHYENSLYRQYEETQALLDKMTARLDRIEQEHKEEIARLKEEHRQEVAELKAEIEKRDKRIAELTARNEALEEEVTRLKSILNNDSHNSSNPPSGDQKPSRKKANEYNSRRKSGRAQGGQKGHKGKTLTPEDVSRMLSSGKCEHNVKIIGRPGGKYVTRYTVDMRVVPVVTEYRIYQNKQGKYLVPAHLWCKVAYSNRLRAFVVALYGIGVMSDDRIADFIQSMTQGVIRIATGTVYGFCRFFSEKATSSLFNMEARLTNRNVSTDDAVMYYDMPHKAVAEMEKIDLLKCHTVPLLIRLGKYKANHLLFLHNFAVSFDNNLSERDLRKCKNRQKMAGGFRTQEGCSMFCDILSVVKTAKRRRINPFEAISSILQGQQAFEGTGAAEL